MKRRLDNMRKEEKRKEEFERKKKEEVLGCFFGTKAILGSALL